MGDCEMDQPFDQEPLTPISSEGRPKQENICHKKHGLLIEITEEEVDRLFTGPMKEKIYLFQALVKAFSEECRDLKRRGDEWNAKGRTTPKPPPYFGRTAYITILREIQQRCNIPHHYLSLDSFNLA